MIGAVDLGLAFLTSTLIGDSQLAALVPGGVNTDMAEVGIPTPYVLIAYQAGGYTLTAGGYQDIAPLLYQAKVTGPAAQSEQIIAAASRMDDLLGGSEEGPVSGPVVIGGTQVGNVDACYPESPLSMGENVNGRLWINKGGLYRLEIERVAT